jgi:hypothetical protein
VGKSSLIAVRVADTPFLDKRPPYFGRASFGHLVTGLGWETVPDLLEKLGTTWRPRNIRQTQLHIINVDPSVSFKKFRPYSLIHWEQSARGLCGIGPGLMV